MPAEKYHASTPRDADIVRWPNALDEFRGAGAAKIEAGGQGAAEEQLRSSRGQDIGKLLVKVKWRALSYALYARSIASCCSSQGLAGEDLAIERLTVRPCS